MLRRPLRTFAIGIATIAMAAFGGPNRTEASIVVTVSDVTTTDVFYAGPGSTYLTTGQFSLGPYTTQVETTTTNYPGGSTISDISTTVNITSVGPGSTAGIPLTVTVMVVKDNATLDALSGSSNGVLVTGVMRPPH